MWNYIIPFLVFVILVVSISVYTQSEDDKDFIKMKAIIASLLISIIVFVFMKYKEDVVEPMMGGNYFDN